jgi:hypothetical protein
MRPNTIFENSLYVIGLMALSLGVPQQCAFEYDLKELLGETDSVKEDKLCGNSELGFTETASLGGVRTRRYARPVEMSFLEANRIHAPPGESGG